MKIGIAFSGGGARGLGHLGMLKALEEYDIKPDVMSGTSAGSIVATMYSYGYSPEEILEIVKKTKVFSSLKPSLSLKGLLSINSLGNILKKYMPEDSFDSLKIPVTVVATDIISGVSVYLEEGSLVESIMASCCVPVFFNPVEKDEMLLVDGGILDNLPASVLKDSCDFLFGLHTNPITGKFKATNFKNIVERSLIMAINGNTLKSKEFCDVIIEPPSLGDFTGFELTRADEMVESAYEYTLKYIEENKKNWKI